MNFRSAMLFCLVVSLGLIFVRPLPLEAAGDSAKGKAIYEKYCMACHGPQGKGNRTHRKDAQAPCSGFHECREQIGL